MTKYLLAAAAVAAIGFAGAAYAGDGAASKPMTDSEMDNVTAAGKPPSEFLGVGVTAADFASENRERGVAKGILPNAIPASGKCVGLGTVTAGGGTCP